MALRQIPAGAAGTEETVWEMFRHIFSYSQEVRRVAESILRESRTQRSPDYLKAAAIYAWVQRRLVYVHDHLMVEELHGPHGLLEDVEDFGEAFGDCDDWVIMMGALLAAVGIEFRVVVTSAREDETFDHTFLAIDTEVGTIYADAIAGAKFGWHVPWERVTNRAEFQIPESLEELGFQSVGDLVGGGGSRR
jgi:hypothetical protein